MKDIFFDIETGGFSGATNPLLSVSWAEEKGPVQSLYADPTAGSKISRWSERKIWEPIRRAGYNRTSEKEVLLRFLKVLETAPEGTRLVGWNIGYSALPQGVSKAGGFDVPFLVSRAREFGLEDRYQKAMKKMRIHDEGVLWAYRIAKTVSREGSRMVREGRLHKDIYMEAVGYLKQATKLASEQGLQTEGQITEALSREGIQFAGWKQESTFKLLFGEKLLGAHQSSEDVAAVRKIMQEASPKLDARFVEQWGRETLENKIVSSLKTVRPGEGPERYMLAMQEAKSWGVLPGVQQKLRQLAWEADVPISVVESGRGIPQSSRVIRGGVLAETAEKAIGGKAGGFVEAVLPLLRSNWGKIAMGAGAAALLALKPGTMFSGKDDEYNVIEGLPHGGQAERMRKMLTDFGSGLIRQMFGSYKVFQQMSTKEVKVAFKQWLKANEVAITKKPARAAVSGFGKNPEVYRAVETELGVRRSTIHFAEKLTSATKDPLAMRAGSRYPTLLHEGSEIAYGQTMLRRGRTPKMFGTHVSPAVIAEEALLSKKLGPKFYKAMKEFRMQEVSQIKQQLIDADQPWLAAIQTGESQAEKLVKRQYVSRVEKIYSSIERSKIPTSNRIPGKDDAYNVIEGLRHGGWAEKMRKFLTHFGSGFTRITRMAEEIAGLGEKAAAKRGVVTIPKELRHYFGDVAGATVETKAAMEHIRGKIANVSKWRSGKQAKELSAAKEMFGKLEGTDWSHITLINPEGVQKAAKSAKISYEEALKGTIAHEQFHQAVRMGGLEDIVREFADDVPAAFRKDFLKRYGKSTAAGGEKMVAEEYVAHSIGAKFGLEGENIALYEGGLEMAEGMAGMTTAILEEGVKRNVARTSSEKAAAVASNVVETQAGATSTQLRKYLSDHSSPVNLDKATQRAQRVFETDGRVAPKPRSGILEPGRQKQRRRQKMVAAHRYAQVKHSANSLRPGKRHRHQTGKVIL